MESASLPAKLGDRYAGSESLPSMKTTRSGFVLLDDVAAPGKPALVVPHGMTTESHGFVIVRASPIIAKVGFTV
jgi:hypothetical protein